MSSRAGLSGVAVAVAVDDIVVGYDVTYSEGGCRTGENGINWTFGLNVLQGCLPSDMKWQVQQG